MYIPYNPDFKRWKRLKIVIIKMYLNRTHGKMESVFNSKQGTMQNQQIINKSTRKEKHIRYLK